VLIPLGADQPQNAARAAETGFALTLDPVAATPDDVRVALAAVLNEPGFRRAAEALRDEIANMPGLEQAVTSLAKIAARPGG
jgi:UDP:flavonoid glycosyltransferase YjiC (YdhE family)